MLLLSGLNFDEEGFQKNDGMIRKWDRKSNKVDIKFPEITSFNIRLENILLIRVLE